MKLPIYWIPLFLTVNIALLGLFLFHQKNITTKTTAAPTITPIIRAIPIPNSPTCIRDPDIQFFMYHYIRTHDPRDNAYTRELSVDPQEFRKQMSYLRDRANEWKIILMNGWDLVSSIATNCFPGNHIWAFTSDDGWSDTYDQLFPIAREYRVPFFLGIITDRIGAIGFVTSKEVREISEDPLFTISSHSMTHDEQDKMSIEVERREMCESKKILENLIEKPVLTYIYPIGKMGQNSQKIARECGYSLAWSTGLGTKWNPTNPSRYDINRIRIHHDTTIDIFAELIQEWK